MIQAGVVLTSAMQRLTWEQANRTKSDIHLAAYKLNGHVLTSGCLGTDPFGHLPESVEEQTVNAILNLENVLKFSGSNLQRVLKVTLYISHASYADAVNVIYRKYFVNQPARSCVVVGFPNPGVKVEIECVAEHEDLTAAKL